MKIRSVVQFLAFAAVSVLAVRSAPAICATGPQTTYRFVGQCTDCTGTGVGLLTLQNYTPGAFLSGCNFVSFAYSSNLVSFTINQGSLMEFSGIIPASLPSPADVLIASSSHDLVSSSDGEWSVDITGDFGSSSSWSLPASGVPTLSFPAIFGLAMMLAIIGVVILKRFPNRRFA